MRELTSMIRGPAGVRRISTCCTPSVMPSADTACTATGPTSGSSGSPALTVCPVSSKYGAKPTSLRVTARGVVIPPAVAHSTEISGPGRYFSTSTPYPSRPCPSAPAEANAHAEGSSSGRSTRITPMLAACEAGLRTTGKSVRCATAVACGRESITVDCADGTPCSANFARLAALFRAQVIDSGVLPVRPRRAASVAVGTSAYSSQVTTPATVCRAASARPAATTASGSRVSAVSWSTSRCCCQVGGLVSMSAMS
jgi:hypothetical protein